MGEIFHGQTKGYMFACDQLHDLNISWKISKTIVCVLFHIIVKNMSYFYGFKHIYKYINDLYVTLFKLIMRMNDDEKNIYDLFSSIFCFFLFLAMY